jgi:type I restriction enzyme S subunit
VKAGWEVRPLGDVYDVRDGTHDSPKYQDEGYPLITSKNLKPEGLTFAKAKFISEEDYLSINRRSQVGQGDLLFAMIGTIGNPTLVEREPNFSIKNIALMKPPKGQCSRFLKYYLETRFVIEKMKIEAGGTTQRFVGLGYLRKFPFPALPLEEQKQIVAVLDAAFEGLTRAKENAEANLQNARELFDRSLAHIYLRELAQCSHFKLGEKCDLISGQHIDAKDYNTFGDGLGYLTGPSDFGTHFPEITKWTNKPKRTAVKNDILVTVKGSGVGKVNMMTANELAISRQLMAVRSDTVSADYLFGFMRLQGPYFQSLANGAAIPGISRADVLELSVPIPSKDEQTSIAERIKLFETEASLLEASYTTKLTDIADLRQSLLQKAFAGELT